MVSKRCTHSRFSLRVRMKRSATPLPSGSRTKGRRGVDAEEGDLVLEVVGHVVWAMVMPEFEPDSDVLADGAEVLAHALPDRLQGLEAVGALVGVDADAFAVT